MECVAPEASQGVVKRLQAELELSREAEKRAAEKLAALQREHDALVADVEAMQAEAKAESDAKAKEIASLNATLSLKRSNERAAS